jgi:hypothetical protein
MSEEQAVEQKKSATLLRLAEHFPASAHKKVSKGAGSQTYVPWTDAVERMNDVLGADWSFRVVREGLTDTEAWVLGEITATVDGVVCVRQHYGCESINKGQRGVADLFKIAASDAIRKAATLIGVGMYLSIQEERAEVEATMQEAVREAARAEREANRPAPKAPTATPAQPSPTRLDDVRRAAMLTGAAPPDRQETPREYWARLVIDAEKVKLPTLGTIKAIDPKVISDAQLQKYIGQLEDRLREARAS